MIHLESQPKGVKVSIRILSTQQYQIELNGNLNFKKDINFGEQFSESGFDFKIKLRDPENFVFNERNSNNYYFYFTDPESLATSTGINYLLNRLKKMHLLSIYQFPDLCRSRKQTILIN